MKRINLNILLALVILTFTYSCSSEETSVAEQPDIVILLTQQDVNEFGENGYINFTGTINIGDDESPDYTPNPSITNLSPLNSLKTVGQLLIVSNTSLTNLNGLNNLTKVNNLFISHNSSLTSLNSLSGCDIGGIDINNNDALTNLDGLSATEETAVVSIEDNFTVRKPRWFIKPYFN